MTKKTCAISHIRQFYIAIHGVIYAKDDFGHIFEYRAYISIDMFSESYIRYNYYNKQLCKSSYISLNDLRNLWFPPKLNTCHQVTDCGESNSNGYPYRMIPEIYLSKCMLHDFYYLNLQHEFKFFYFETYAFEFHS